MAGQVDRCMIRRLTIPTVLSRHRSLENPNGDFSVKKT